VASYILQFPATGGFLTAKLQSEAPLNTILLCNLYTTSNEEIFPAFIQTLDGAIAKEVKCLEEVHNGVLDSTRDLSYVCNVDFHCVDLQHAKIRC